MINHKNCQLRRSGFRNRAAESGFSIIELVVTIVILAIALVGVAAMIGQGTANSANTLLDTRAIALGHAYLDEIIGRRFDERSASSGLRPCFGLVGASRCSAEADFGTDGGESSRRRFDDVDDYHGLVEGDGEGTPIQDAEGNTRSGYDNFHIAISVRYAGDDTVTGLAETHSKLITVNVRNRGQTNGWDFSVYKGNY